MREHFAKVAITLTLSMAVIVGCGVPPAHQAMIQVPPLPIASPSDSTQALAINLHENRLASEAGAGVNDGANQKVTNTSVPKSVIGATPVGSTAGPVGATGSATGSASNPGIPPLGTSGVPQIFSVPLGEVALTIDDGPSPYTEQMIAILNAYHAKATFFFIGNNALAFPNAVRMAAASGDEIGDHTVSHPQLTHLSFSMQQQEIIQAAKDIALYDPNPITLFRPPYELLNRDTLTILAQNHLALALWNRDTKDWAAKTPDQIVQAVLAGNPSGGVFDLHDKLLTLQALPAILKGLAAMHLQIVMLPSTTY